MKKVVESLLLIMCFVAVSSAYAAVNQVYAPRLDGSVEFDFDRPGQLIGRCLENSGNGHLVKTSPTDGFRLTCTIPVLSKADLLKNGLWTRYDEDADIRIRVERSADGQPLLAPFTKKEAYLFLNSTPVYDKDFNITHIGIQFIIYCSKSSYNHKTCSEQYLLGLARGAGDFFGAKVTTGILNEVISHGGDNGSGGVCGSGC